jgi:hypothetical protein
MATHPVLERFSNTAAPIASNEAAARPLRLALTTQEACTALGICSVSLWRLEKKGLIRAVPHLRHKMWPIKELERFLNSAAA